MKSLTLISLVRHGHVYNPQSVYYGRSPRFRLSKEGNLQAKATSRILQNQKLIAIFSSPLLRARQTALIIRAAHTYVPLHISKLLNEVHTPFDRRPATEVMARKWDVYTDVPPEYEQPTDVLERGQKFISRVRQKHPHKHIVAVTHGDLIAFLILWAKSLPINPEHKQDFRRWGFPDKYPEPGSIVTFAFHTAAIDELPSVEYVNPSYYNAR